MKKENFKHLFYKVAILCVLSASLALPSWGSQARGIKIRSYLVPGNGELQLNVPMSWVEDIKPGVAGSSPTIVMQNPDSDDFKVIISVLSDDQKRPLFQSKWELREMVKQVGTELLNYSEEADLTIYEIKGADSIGYVYFLTDPAPGEGEYKYLKQGAVGVGNLLLTVTVLNNTADSRLDWDAIEMLIDARHIIYAANSLVSE